MTLFDDTITEYQTFSLTYRNEHYLKDSHESLLFYLAFCVNRQTQYLEKILTKLNEVK